MANIISSPEDDFELPSYNEPGQILILVRGDDFDKSEQFEVIDHSGCAFWITEGMGFDYWLKAYEFPKPGLYLIRNVTVTGHRDYYGEYDEDWNSDEPIRVRWWHRILQWWTGRGLWEVK